MTNNTGLMYNTSPLPPYGSRAVIADVPRRNYSLVGNIELTFHSNTEYPATPYNVSFVPDMRSNFFSFHVVQKHQTIVLSRRSGAHLLDGRLAFPHKKNGSYIRATMVPSDQDRTLVEV